MSKLSKDDYFYSVNGAGKDIPLWKKTVVNIVAFIGMVVVITGSTSYSIYQTNKAYSEEKEEKIQQERQQKDMESVYGNTDENGYNDVLGNTFYIMNEDVNIPEGAAGYVNPDDHKSEWNMTTLVDGGTDTEYLIIYMKDHPEYGIAITERRKYEERNK